MRLIKWILTAIVFATTFIIVLLAQYMTLAIITLPGGDETVDRVHIFPDPTATEVGYSDAINFWRDDMRVSLELEPDFVIRAWFDWNWWKQGMKWADTAWSSVKAVTVPLITPVHEFKELYVFYGKNIEDFIIVAPQGTFLTGDQIARNAAIQIYMTNGLKDLSDTQDYKYVYNLLLNIEKYNNPVFEQYVEKFINYSYKEVLTPQIDAEGNPVLNENNEQVFVTESVRVFESIDAISIFLFYQIFLAFILSIYWTYQNPISVSRNDSNEAEVNGKFLPKIPRPSFGKRKKK